MCKSKLSPLLFYLLIYNLKWLAAENTADNSKVLFPNVTQTYYSNDEMVTHMRQFTLSTKCGKISRLFSVGSSVGGRQLWVMELALHPGRPEAKPNVKYVANMHGDETSGRQLLLRLAEWLCDNYQTNAKAARVIEEMHLFLMPSMNPDGYEAFTRENLEGVDLNRDFPDRFSPKKKGLLVATGEEAAESLALMNWITQGFFVASGNLHEGALVANYPWDAASKTLQSPPYPYATCPDDETFKHLAKVYSYAHTTMHDSKEFPDGIVNGNAWYPVHGSMQDYNYIMGNCMELTLELSDVKNPPASLLEDIWQQNKDAFLDFIIVAALGGFRGVVNDKDGMPLAATIRVHGIKMQYYTRPEFGDFYRPLSPGGYNITVSAEGYESVATAITIPSDGLSTNYSFTLLSLDTPRGFRIMQAEVYNNEQGHVWQPPVLLALFLAVFLTIGGLQVFRTTSIVRPK